MKIPTVVVRILRDEDKKHHSAVTVFIQRARCFSRHGCLGWFGIKEVKIKSCVDEAGAQQGGDDGREGGAKPGEMGTSLGQRMLRNVNRVGGAHI